MKHSFKLLLAAFAIVAAASCSKETAPAGEQTPELPAQGLVPMTFTASIDATKATLEAAKVNWEETDEIAVFDGTAKQIFTVLECDGTTATFTGSVTEGATEFYAVYPASAGSALSEGSLTVEIPAEQKIASGKSVDGNALVMVAKGDESTLAFKNVVSLVKCTVAADGVESITFAGNDNEKIAGAATAAADGTATCTGAAAVTIAAERGTLAQGDYYIAVAPASLESGIIVTCDTEDEGKIFKTSDNALTLERSKYTDIKTVTDGDDIPNPIMTKQQLKNWAKWMDKYGADDTVMLGANIDMDGETWKTVDPTCKFDGQGHSIYNFKVTGDGIYVGFFGLVQNDISNLSFGTSDGVNYDGTSTITFENTSDTAEWHYMGAIARCQCNMDGVFNFAEVSVTEATVSKNRIGGLLGMADGSKKTVSNCGNFGSVTNYTNKAAVEQLLGGFCATLNSTTTFKDCFNSGDVTNVSSGYASCIGGIISNISKGKAGKLEGCRNYGKISNTATVTSATENNIGGIAGYTNGGDGTSYVITVTNCVNEGEVFSKAPLTIMFGGIVGRATLTNVKGCTNKGSLKFDGANVATKALGLGGIIGQTYSSKIEDCTNMGFIYTNKKQVNRTGGIIGTTAGNDADVANLITGCTNNGSITVAQSVTNTNWQACGGIVGFQENVTASNKITNCTNNGDISATFFSTNADSRVSAGGILGACKVGSELSGCVNYAPVSAENKAAGAIHCGGIIGQDDFGTAYTMPVTGNKNFGDLDAKAAEGGTVNVGGILGRHTRVAASGNISRCDIEGAGKIGAVVGLNVSADITGTQVAGSVGGTALTSANVESLAAGQITAGTVSGTTLYTE